MKKVVVWDLDGTILDTLDDLADSVNFTMEYFGFAKFDVGEIRKKLGNGVKDLIQKSVPSDCVGDKFDKVLDFFKKHYFQNMNNKTRPYRGICEVMEKLKNIGYRQAIVSNKFDDAVQELAKKYYPVVDLAVGERKDLKKKPCPDAVNWVLSKLKCDKNEAVYVGDSEVDLQTAKNSEIDCISVLWGFRDRDFLEKNGAVILVDNPNSLFNVLAEMRSLDD